MTWEFCENDILPSITANFLNFIRHSVDIPHQLKLFSFKQLSTVFSTAWHRGSSQVSHFSLDDSLFHYIRCDITEKFACTLFVATNIANSTFSRYLQLVIAIASCPILKLKRARKQLILHHVAASYAIACLTLFRTIHCFEIILRTTHCFESHFQRIFHIKFTAKIYLITNKRILLFNRSPAQIRLTEFCRSSTNSATFAQHT